MRNAIKMSVHTKSVTSLNMIFPRGLSLCDTRSQPYSTIINNRQREWFEQNNITGEYQAGFRRGYSTTDHMFTLLACVQKQFAANRKLYVAFIDLKKAFDSSNRNLLWPILLNSGIKGKLFRCTKVCTIMCKLESDVEICELYCQSETGRRV